MGKHTVWTLSVIALLLLPATGHAQLATDIRGLQGVLDTLYNTMMPMCSDLIGVGRGLAGFAALWYIASRVWKHLASAEAIDFYPLLRPFGIGLCILFFPAVLGLINGVMQPTVSGTSAMVDNSNAAIGRLLEQREKALQQTEKWQIYMGLKGEGDRSKWYKYTYGKDIETEGFMEGVGNSILFASEKLRFQFQHSVKEWMSEVLRILFEAAALCINTLRTFQLLVLSILGPLVFGIAVFDGFQHTLTVWLARYINIFLWLPVANLFGAIIGKVQEEMIKMDVQQLESAGNTFFSSTDVGYLIFMVIGIIGYLSVPSVANYIVHAAGGGALQQKTTNVVVGGAMGAAGTAGAMAVGGGWAGLTMGADAFGNAASSMRSGMAEQKTSEGYFNDKLKGNP